MGEGIFLIIDEHENKHKTLKTKQSNPSEGGFYGFFTR
jgi:hypothetical protein